MEMTLTSAGKLPKPGPNFWLVDGTNNRVSEEFSSAPAAVDFATEKGLLARPDIMVGASWVTCGRVPLALFVSTVQQGLLPANATLLHFNIPQELRYKQPLVATKQELRAIEAGTLTELRRRAEYISEVYKKGKMEGQPKSLRYPNVHSMVDWTQQELLLAFPCYYGQPGDTLCFPEAPEVLFTIEDLVFVANEEARYWEWVLTLRRN